MADVESRSFIMEEYKPSVEARKSKYKIEESIACITKYLAESEFLKHVDEAKRKFDFKNSDGWTSPYRQLTEAEKFQLERQNVTAEDWTKVMVTKDGFNASRIHNTNFHGEVRLGAFRGRVSVGTKNVTLQSGIYNSDLHNVVVLDEALVSRNALLSNVVVGRGACVLGCGEVLCTGQTNFGNGAELPLAIETGGRETRVFAEITIACAAGVASNRGDKALLKKYNDLVDTYCAKATSPATIIGNGAKVLHTQKVINVYVGPGGVIDSASWVENVTMLSDPPKEIPKILSGCYVKNTILQWASEVDGLALAMNSVLCEHSHVERHGKMTDSILGPNSGVAEGECTASLCGPFVGFHHQSLLIAAFWPEGKGNVGYGANVGSNHTSKAPDQELWCGEGTFFGLGTSIKFPADFTQGPYSIIASGVVTLPQRMAMPFSLVNSPAESITGLSPAYNQIFPGWVLSDNIYTLRRNENKYIRRNKAKRNHFIFDVLRPETVDECLRARQALVDAEGRAELKDDRGQAVYTDKQIRGLGKNYCKEDDRVKAIRVYTFYIQYYAVMGLYEQLSKGADPDTVLKVEKDDHFWKHQRVVIERELPEVSVRDLITKVVADKEKITKDVRKAKEKDDIRGISIIRDYLDAHGHASQDGFVRESETRMEEVRVQMSQVIEYIDARTASKNAPA
eukprot:comp19354_c0_seq1/m.22294 comp19354_c0_seq1/g.22294  ORF comp19354_c0_seq1/g.22294 comp19354_c0_seq1/m.22294 type:complete len:681 (-) comp19354_c0_seq1:927-2969(-)